MADAHPAAERHADPGLLAGLQHRGGAVGVDGLAGVAERDGAALAAVAAELEREPFEVQRVRQAGLARSAPRSRPASAPGRTPRSPARASRGRGDRGRRGRACRRVSVCSRCRVRLSCRSSRSASSSRKIIRLGRRRRVVHDHVRQRAAPVERAQHRHHGRDAAAGDQEQHPLGGGSGSTKSPSGSASRTMVPGSQTVHEMGRQQALGHRPDRDRDRATVPLRRRADRVRAPLVAAVDLHRDADVLARPVVVAPAPARPDDQRRGVVGLLDDLLDPAAQLALGPQRVDQAQVVVGMQRGRQLGPGLADAGPGQGACCHGSPFSVSLVGSVNGVVPRTRSVNTCRLNSST